MKRVGVEVPSRSTTEPTDGSARGGGGEGEGESSSSAAAAAAAAGAAAPVGPPDYARLEKLLEESEQCRVFMRAGGGVALAKLQGGAVQVFSIKIRIDPRLVSSFDSRMSLTAFKYCFQFQLAPLQQGELAKATWAAPGGGESTTAVGPGQICCHVIGCHPTQ